MKRRNVANCMFISWYPLFKHVTVDSCIIQLPRPVLDYLLSDGLVLPDSCQESSTSHVVDDSDDEVDWGTSSAEAAPAPHFPEFEATVDHDIAKLGGCVFPKLDWSSPKDAVWVTCGHTLQCKNLCDIFLLLKSSDFVTHDLNDPFDSCEDSEGISDARHLVLREWLDIAPDSEFRCFVRNNAIIGISQRHVGVLYPSIVESKEQICHSIVTFFDEHIKNRFFDADFTFDVLCKSPGSVTLIDFNPFAPVTDGLLFNWEQLLAPDNSTKPPALDFRCVETKEGIQPDPYRFYAVPQDFVHLTAGIDPAKFCDLLHLKLQNPNGDDSDSD